MTSNFDLGKALKQRQTSEYQRTYLWRLMLPNLNKNIPDAFGQTVDRIGFFSSNNLFVPDNTLIENRIRSVNMPFLSIGTDKERVGNMYYYYGTKKDISTITLDVYEGTDGATFQYFDAWAKLATAPRQATRGPHNGTTINHTSNPPVYYKFDVYMVRLDTSKLDLYVDTYNGFFLNDIANVSSDYDTSGFMSYTITLTGDTMTTRTYSSSQTDIVNKNVDILNQTLNVQRKFGQLTPQEIQNLIPSIYDAFS